MWGPFLASVAFGFLKGYVSQNTAVHGFDSRTHFIGPVKEELLYRGVPLWAVPGLPYGATAVTFAVDHCISDYRQAPMSATSLAARFGDVLFGGLAYELAARRSGILGAIASHMAHNFATSLGVRARGPK